MANTNIEALFPEFWTESFDQLDIGDYGLHTQVNTDPSMQLQRAGDTVNVPITPEMGAADDYVPGANSGGDTGITQESIPVNLDFSKKKSFVLTAKELSQSPYDLITNYGVPAMKSLIQSLNQYVYLLMLQSNYLVDARASFDEDDIVDAKTILDENEVTMTNRYLIAGPSDYGAMIKVAKFSDADRSGDTLTLQDGKLPRRYGFELGMNNGINTYTPADLAGAINNVAGYTTESTIAVDAFDDDANPIRVGDIFTVASESGGPLHTVTSTTKTSSDTTGITFLTKHDQVNAAKANDAVVTVVPTRSLLAFTRSAVALAIRPYGVLPGSVGTNQTIGDFRGMPVRISMAQKDFDLRVQFDILAGGAVVNPKRVVRIIR